MENKLVFIESGKINAIPFTTSDVIAEYAGIKHHAVQQIISKHENDLKDFGAIAFEMREVTKNGGKNYAKIYHLNEEQATLLITYLRNTPPVREFKKALVHEFFKMRSELMKRQVYREQLKPIRLGMTDAIQADPKSNEWSYKQYTDLAYKAVIGKSAAQVRKDRGAKRSAVAIDYMTSEEIAKITKKQDQIGMLLDLGMDYQQVKSLLLDKQLTTPIKKSDSEIA